MNNNNFDDFNDQFVLSYELVKLMDWIVKHNPEGFKKLINNTIKKAQKGLNPDRAKSYNDSSNVEDLQSAIIDFFSLMEHCIDENQDEKFLDMVIENDLLPTIDHIDSKIMDDQTLQLSLEATCTKFTKKPSKPRAKEIFYKELLKQWKPNNQISEEN